MKDFLSLLMRLVFGLLMIFNHGIPKINKIDNAIIIFPDPLGVSPEISLYLAIFAEVLMAFFVVMGLLTRWSVVPLIFTMAVAAFVVHSGDPLKEMEMSILYLTAFIAIGIQGGGKYSVDFLLKKRR